MPATERRAETTGYRIDGDYNEEIDVKDQDRQEIVMSAAEVARRFPRAAQAYGIKPAPPAKTAKSQAQPRRPRGSIRR